MYSIILINKVLLSFYFFLFESFLSLETVFLDLITTGKILVAALGYIIVTNLLILL